MINMIQGDLFDNAPTGAILIHACNTKGVWGSGIAPQFAKRWPHAYNAYHLECKNKGSSLLGTTFIIPTSTGAVGCLFTSRGYGGNKDVPFKILKSTEQSIEDLLIQTPVREFWMPKINSGAFAVDWNDTKKILKKFNATFNVCYFG